MSDTAADLHPGFEDFYASEHGRLVTTLLLATGDAEIAREATDEAFTRALQAWRRVQHMDSPAGWTYRVALNVVRRRGRRAALERRLLAGRARPAGTGVVPPPAGEAWHLVAELPDRQRTAVVLRFVADLTEVEIAKVMGVSRSTVSSTLADATRSLGRALAEEPQPSGDLHG